MTRKLQPVACQDDIGEDIGVRLPQEARGSNKITGSKSRRLAKQSREVLATIVVQSDNKPLPPVVQVAAMAFCNTLGDANTEQGRAIGSRKISLIFRFTASFPEPESDHRSRH